MDAGQRRFELGVAEKAARLRRLRLALQGEADSQKWLSHVALRYAGKVDRQKRVQGGGVGMEEKKDGKALKTLRLQITSTNLTRTHSTCILPLELTVS